MMTVFAFAIALAAGCPDAEAAAARTVTAYRDVLTSEADPSTSTATSTLTIANGDFADAVKTCLRAREAATLRAPRGRFAAVVLAARTLAMERVSGGRNPMSALHRSEVMSGLKKLPPLKRKKPKGHAP